MKSVYELIRLEDGLPVKAFVHSVNGLDFENHWHNEIEILLVLEGSVNVKIGNYDYILNEKDLLLINGNEIHSTNKTSEDNILLTIQIDKEYYANYYPKFKDINFDCNSLTASKDDEYKFNEIRSYLAGIVWQLNEGGEGYQLILASELNLLANYLLNNFDYTFVDNEDIGVKDEEIKRIKSILGYINDNLEKKITLQELAKREHLNIYYLSHFFKKKIGISFQEYITTKRLDKAINYLQSTNKTITEVSDDSGFSSTNYFNKIFRETYDCSPTEYRKEFVDMNYGYKCKITDKSKAITYFNMDRAIINEKLFVYLKPDLSTKFTVETSNKT